MTFEDYWRKATGGLTAFGFQQDFATAGEPKTLVRVPTGLGKTAMAVLGWLWRRQFADSQVRRATPRRLVYCLPMRVLVEQTKKSVKSWLSNFDLESELRVHVLMGGEQIEDWDLHPERDAVLIGTQDMLLSRALNRGYAMSRYRWPLPFGLLNNDCFWVFDEVQLMDVGVATSAQLEGFRRDMQVFGPAHSVWMSATLQESWLETVDFPKQLLGHSLELDGEDLQNEHIRRLWTAPKPLRKAADAPMGNAKSCAGAIAEAHRAGTKTLAVFNTVRRAVEVYQDLSERPGLPDVVLIHSRFRPGDRQKQLDALLDDGREVIAVTTQVVEAGVDISAATLLTDLAPWASVVQRFGRCNRKGEDREAQVIWFDPGEMDDKFRDAPPYDVEQLRRARELMLSCENVSLEALDSLDADMPFEPAHVIRRRDLIDLFDTTPDLAGNDIDVSRFIRSGDEHDATVFWRRFENDPEGQPAPHRDEFCSVPVGELKAFRKDNRSEVWRWDGLDEGWRRIEERDIYAGQTYLIRATAGGYTAEAGWNLKSKTAVAPAELPDHPPDAHSRDFEAGPWLSIGEHTEDVVRKLEEILASLALPEDLLRELGDAARWHDWGKAHEQFQKAFPDRPDEWQGRADVAKGLWKGYEKKGFRHELASALGMLALERSDLSAYLVAAHHGKVRLSIRSMPNEKRPPEPERLYARGVWDQDVLPETSLGGGVTTPETRLSLEPMRMGRSPSGAMSWAERMVRLRDKHGPFELAYLEALLRAADMRASEEEAKRAPEERP